MTAFGYLVIFCVMVHWIPSVTPSIEPPPSKDSCPGLAIPIPKGEKGDPGTPGAAGKDGVPGAQGATGGVGAKGDTGAKGGNGDPGSAGAKGDEGQPGPQGIKGENGTQGTCDGECGDVQKLNASFQSLLANYTQQVADLKNKINYLERNIFYALGTEENPAISCKEILKRDSNAKDGVYYIQAYEVPRGKLKVYCAMVQYDENCPGGLTEVMKIDGSKTTFKFSSSYWTNKIDYEPAKGQSGLDYEQTKLPTYWSTPFTKICIRMRERGSWRFRSKTLDVKANCLFDLIADNQYRATSLGLSSWKSLLGYSTLQSSCQKEGFNVQGKTSANARARIGIIGDDVSTCDYPDSFIGLGTAGSTCGVDPKTSCGNEAGCNGKDGSNHVQAFGYIFVY